MRPNVQYTAVNKTKAESSLAHSLILRTKKWFGKIDFSSVHVYELKNRFTLRIASDAVKILEDGRHDSQLFHV